MGDRYGRSDVNAISIGYSIWNMISQYRYLPYRYGHHGYRYGIWSKEIGGDSIDTASSISIWHILSLCLKREQSFMLDL